MWAPKRTNGCLCACMLGKLCYSCYHGWIEANFALKLGLWANTLNGTSEEKTQHCVNIASKGRKEKVGKGQTAFGEGGSCFPCDSFPKEIYCICLTEIPTRCSP